MGKSCKSRRCKRKKRYGCNKKCCRGKVVRTTKCKGGCIPTNAQILQTRGCYGNTATLTGCGTSSLTHRHLDDFGRAFDHTHSYGNVPHTHDTLQNTTLGSTLHTHATSCGSTFQHSHVGGNVLHTHNTLGSSSYGTTLSSATLPVDPRFDHLTTGSYYGSTESHLHRDRNGNIYCHSHSGGDLPHSHDMCNQDTYLGRVSDCRALTSDPDSLDKDVIGGSDVGCCASSGSTTSTTSTPLTSTSTSSCLPTATPLSSVRPYTGNLVGGFRDTTLSGCTNCQLTSASYCDGSSLGHCNVVAPGNCNTLPPQSLNARAKTPDLRGINNAGLSCITGSLCGTKRPTVCKTKLKEVYCC